MNWAEFIEVELNWNGISSTESIYNDNNEVRLKNELSKFIRDEIKCTELTLILIKEKKKTWLPL